MYGVYFVVIFLHFKLLVRERIDTSADDAHLVFIESQVFDAVGVLHDLFDPDCEVLQREAGVLGNIDVQLL
jgi:hypothetical protein